MKFGFLNLNVDINDDIKICTPECTGITRKSTGAG